ncbi:histidine kinase [Streptomyces canus]|uniref:GAF domain-containing sensor histidine kinase n=1 Tax=Streptomyces canus TaxID=58343 RepID=UPI0038638F00|nr:histidine kinase [Streptomyces canus]
MAEANLVTLAVPVPGTGNLVVEAAAGQDTNRVHGLVLPDTTLAAKVYSSGETITTDDWNTDPRTEHDTALLPLGPAFLVPLGTPEHVRGVLLAGFANHAALALEIAEHRRDAEQFMLLGDRDRDRIARDLHDLAIQRLFAGGLTLQSVLTQFTDRPQAAERIERVVDDLDETIKIIRSTIYALGRRASDGDTGLRARLVLREALTNTARHAHATAVDVTAEATVTHLMLRISDDGRGIDPTRTRRSGLANLHARAAELGGTLTLTPRRPTGTTLEWTVPLSADKD